MIVKQLLEHLSLPSIDPKHTVDGLIYGDENAEIQEIVTAFTCNVEVIAYAVQQGANVIVTHESLYYQHHDQFEAFGRSSVIEEKLALLDKHELHVIRAHDYPHRCTPDLITAGLASQLGWTLSDSDTCQFEPCLISELISYVKERLGISKVQFVGDLNQMVHKAFVSVGFRGNGSNCIPIIEQEQVDVLIVGEGYEWEMPEYVRDAQALGHSLSYLVVGHQCSEEWGMSLLARDLQAKFPSVPITHKVSQSVIHYV